MKIKALLIALLLSTPFILLAQDATDYISAEEMKKDLKILSESLYELHPKFTDSLFAAGMQAKIGALEASLKDSMRSEDFHLEVKRLVAEIECGHTFAYPSAAWYTAVRKSPSLLPFDVHVVDGRTYIKQAFDKDSILTPGTEILLIDNHACPKVLDAMRAIQHRDQEALSYVDYKIERMFRTYYLFLYGGDSTYTITCRNEAGTQEVQVKPVKDIKRKDAPDYLADYKISFKKEGNKACLYILESPEKTAVLDIDAFESRKYKRFYKRVFKELEKQDIQHLIIDLRSNGGGYFLNGNELLSYLLKEEFYFYSKKRNSDIPKGEHFRLKRFEKWTMHLFNMMPDRDEEDPMRNYAVRKKAKKKRAYTNQLYVLTNGGSFSLSSYTSAYLKYHTKASFVGQETGGGEAGSNAILFFKLTLPYSGVRIQVPHYYIDHKIPVQSVKGVSPDYPVSYDLEELLQQKDKEMEMILKLINNPYTF